MAWRRGLVTVVFGVLGWLGASAVLYLLNASGQVAGAIGLLVGIVAALATYRRRDW